MHGSAGKYYNLGTKLECTVRILAIRSPYCPGCTGKCYQFILKPTPCTYVRTRVGVRQLTSVVQLHIHGEKHDTVFKIESANTFQILKLLIIVLWLQFQ